MVKSHDKKICKTVLLKLYYGSCIINLASRLIASETNPTMEI